jgi:hypothetical protein
MNDDAADRVLGEGELVLSHQWDGGTSCGIVAVYRLGRIYYAVGEEGVEGPYPSIDAAADAVEAFAVTAATVRIDAAGLSASQLRSRPRWHADKGIRVNGEAAVPPWRNGRR